MNRTKPRLSFWREPADEQASAGRVRITGTA